MESHFREVATFLTTLQDQLGTRVEQMGVVVIVSIFSPYFCTAIKNHLKFRSPFSNAAQ